jgi:hypothetical protein
MSRRQVRERHDVLRLCPSWVLFLVFHARGIVHAACHLYRVTRGRTIARKSMVFDHVFEAAWNAWNRLASERGHFMVSQRGRPASA